MVFIYFVAKGYVNLFEKTMPVFAYVAGLVFALIAWNLAKIIGSEDSGIRRFRPLFVLLLLISALGIFNALFTILESKPILEETVKDSQKKFQAVRMAAENIQEKKGISERVSVINSALKQLNDEIQNPMKCGQGPKANEAIVKLSSLLPGFVPLANGAGAGCQQADAVTATYISKVDQLTANAPWNNADLQAVITNSNTALEKLDKAKLKAREGSISAVSRLLDEVEPVYSEAASTIRSYDDESSVAADLDLVQLKSIGEWSQILNLVIGRIGYPSTYLYFAISVFADWMMIYFFALLRQSNEIARGQRQRASSELGRPW